MTTAAAVAFEYLPQHYPAYDAYDLDYLQTNELPLFMYAVLAFSYGFRLPSGNSDCINGNLLWKKPELMCRGTLSAFFSRNPVAI